MFKLLCLDPGSHLHYGVPSVAKSLFDYPIILLKSNKFSMAALSVKSSILTSEKVDCESEDTRDS